MERKVFTKGNRFLSILILIIILTISILIMLSIIDKYYNWFGFNYLQTNNESILPDTTCPVDTVGEERPTDYYSDDEESDEGDDEDVISTYSLASLWENPQDDEKIIQDLIIFYIDRILRLDGQGSLADINYNNVIYSYFGVTTPEEDEELLKYVEDKNQHAYISNTIKIKDKIGREPNKILSVFYTYKHLLYKSLSQKNYYKSDLNNYVDILILSYKDIHTNDDPKNVLIKLYNNAILDFYDSDYDTAYTIGNIVSEDYNREYRNIYYGNGSKVRDEDLFWAYTFWARRHKENNVKEVYEILKEVQNHYAE